MENKLQINLFSCSDKAHRFLFTKKMVNEICNIQHIDKVRLCIYVEEILFNQWVGYFKINKPRFDIQLIKCANSDYLSRVHHAQKTEFKYSCKLDDDVLVSRHVWDFIIENLHVIDKQHPIIAPILTNGIPSVELFARDFLTDEEREKAYDILLKGSVADEFWGLNYTAINQKIKSMSEWNGREYWDYVAIADTQWETRPVPWGYFQVRGVHPARFSAEYNFYIADIISKNKEKFFGKNAYGFEEYKAPYFTNNMFISETSFWKRSLGIAHDGWDEGQLSLQMSIDDATPLYITNGFGIHMAYGMTERQQEIEQHYIYKI